jgi:hypothetical protein
MSHSEEGAPPAKPKKNEKRRVSLDGQDPIEVLKRLLDTKPDSQPREKEDPPRRE